MLENILISELVVKDENGIYVIKNDIKDEVRTSQIAWENIYNYDLEKLKSFQENYNRHQLQDILGYIFKYKKLDVSTIYLEIGCGPANIGTHLLKDLGIPFVGIDFNYKILLSLKKYYESLGLTNYILIYGDINQMPIKENSVDFIYGGGVIEHFPDTNNIISLMHKILKPGGVALNTVPSLNLFWVTRFYADIPKIPLLRTLFEFLHIKLFRNVLLEKFCGYQLSFSLNDLKSMHKKMGFSKIEGGSFAFHSPNIPNGILYSFFYFLQGNRLTGAMLHVAAHK